MTAMMDHFIEGDVAKHIWSFFLEFDDDCDEDSGPPSTKEKKSSTILVAPLLDRRVDFQSIRSLRSVNKIFYRAFEEISGWSRCALAIKREYQNLKNDEKFFDNWSFVFRLQTLRATNHQHHIPPIVLHDSNNNSSNNNNISNNNPAAAANHNHWTTREERRQVVKFVTRAMERKKVSVYRCNQLIRMLDRGPFTKDDKLLKDKLLLVAQ